MANWDLILGAAGIGAGVGTSIWAANKAAGSIEDAAARGDEIAREQLAFQKELLAPYQAVGTPALNALAYGMGLQPGTSANALRPAGEAGFSTFGQYTPLDFTFGRQGGGVLGNVSSGASIGGSVAGPPGAAVGAAVGAGASLFGRGRREADQLVPAQNALAKESERIGNLIASGQISAREGGQYMQGLLDAYRTSAGEFGRAGPGAIETVNRYIQPTIAEWAASAPAETPAAGQNAMAGPAGLEFGEFNKTFTGADLASEPGYQFALEQGLSDIERQLASRGKLLSGQAGQDLTRYAEDYAGTKFNDAFNRFQINQDARWNRLASLAGLGQTATTQLLGASGNYGNQVIGNAFAAGEGRAAGAIGTGTAINEGIQTGIDLWNQRRVMNALAPQPELQGA